MSQAKAATASKPAKTATTAKPEILKPFLEFRYLKNVIIGDLGNGVYYAIPVRMAQVQNPNLKVRDQYDVRTGEKIDNPSQYITQPVFDMDKVHKVELQNERPIIPKKLPGTSDGHFQKLCDRAYTKAAEAKIANDEIRRRVYHYAAQGAIEVVSDPFKGDEVVEGLDELVEAMRDAQATEEPEVPELKQRRKAA